MKLLNKPLAFSLVLLMFSGFSHANPISSFFSSTKEDKAIYGDAQHFYDTDKQSFIDRTRQDSDELTELAEELHKEYDLFIARYKTPSETYIGEYNKDKVKVSSLVTAYSELNFAKHGDNYRLAYTTPKGDRTIFYDLDSKYNEKIDQLFLDLKRTAHFVQIQGASAYGRGGSHLTATHLPKLRSLTLICTNEVYPSDNSGGNSCKTVSSKIDFSHATDTKVYVHSINSSSTIVPIKNLKTWADDYWNGKI